MDDAVKEYYKELRRKAHLTTKAKPLLERRKMTAKARFTQIAKQDSLQAATLWLFNKFEEKDALELLNKWN